MLAIVGVGSLVIAVVLLVRGGGARASSGPALFDKNRDAHVALVGAWRCSNEEGGFNRNETLVLLDGGRYTRQLQRTGELWMSLEERSGSWEVQGERVLFTVDSCSEYNTPNTKLCSPSHTLVQNLELPVTDEIKLGESCALKRLAK